MIPFSNAPEEPKTTTDPQPTSSFVIARSDKAYDKFRETKK